LIETELAAWTAGIVAEKAWASVIEAELAAWTAADEALNVSVSLIETEGAVCTAARAAVKTWISVTKAVSTAWVTETVPVTDGFEVLSRMPNGIARWYVPVSLMMTPLKAYWRAMGYTTASLGSIQTVAEGLARQTRAFIGPFICGVKVTESVCKTGVEIPGSVQVAELVGTALPAVP